MDKRYLGGERIERNGWGVEGRKQMDLCRTRGCGVEIEKKNSGKIGNGEGGTTILLASGWGRMMILYEYTEYRRLG